MSIRRSRRAPAPDPPAEAPADPLQCADPVADWIAFLAKRLTAEFLRDIAEGGETT